MTTQTSDTNRIVAARRMKFEDELAQVPKHFAADGDVALSHFYAMLSAVFPEGEDFFVRSVRHYRDQITDPVLKRQVAGFIGQEAMHSKEHAAFNGRLSELGYPVKLLDRMTGIGMRAREKVAPAKANLASTIFIEHVTAILAEIILTDEHTQAELGHETVRNVYLWHAYEESEHKAVAFDVYRAIGGSERLRIWTGRLMRQGVRFIWLGILLSMLTDRATYRPGNLRRGIRSLRRSRVLSMKTYEALKEFDRPGFHPNDRDTDHVLEAWRERLFGDGGELQQNLVRPAAA